MPLFDGSQGSDKTWLSVSVYRTKQIVSDGLAVGSQINSDEAYLVPLNHSVFVDSVVYGRVKEDAGGVERCRVGPTLLRPEIGVHLVDIPAAEPCLAVLAGFENRRELGVDDRPLSGSCDGCERRRTLKHMSVCIDGRTSAIPPD